MITLTNDNLNDVTFDLFRQSILIHLVKGVSLVILDKDGKRLAYGATRFKEDVSNRSVCLKESLVVRRSGIAKCCIMTALNGMSQVIAPILTPLNCPPIGGQLYVLVNNDYMEKGKDEPNYFHIDLKFSC